MSPRSRRGAVLLEALVALTVMATIGGAATVLASETLRAVASVHQREAQTRLADGLLTAVTLWSRADLDRHLGTRAQGPLMMRIDRPSTRVYAVSLMDSATGKLLLQTSLFRKESGP